MNVEDQEKLRRFNEEWDTAHTSGKPQNPMDSGQPNTPNAPSNLAESINMTSLQPNTTPYQPPVIPTTGDRCGECGTLHPALPPGESCPVAAEQKAKAVQAPHVPAQEPHQTQVVHETPAPQPQPVQPLTEGDFKTNMNDVSTVPPRPVNPPPAPQPQPAAQPEPEPLVAENNIPTEIHVNKYLKMWGDLIQTHCKTHNIQNVKRLMRHLTVEVTDFLELNKGR